MDDGDFAAIIHLSFLELPIVSWIYGSLSVNSACGLQSFADTPHPA